MTLTRRPRDARVTPRLGPGQREARETLGVTLSETAGVTHGAYARDRGHQLVRQVLEALAARQLRLAVAEGDSGGLLLEWLTAVPGSSAVVLGGVVAYHDDLKRGLLGIDATMIQTHGAVSAEVVEAMARAIRRVVVGADIGLATTGIAGPGGATPTKPVGLAYVAAADGRHCLVRQFHWQGDRKANRQSSAASALALTLDLIKPVVSRTGVLHSAQK